MLIASPEVHDLDTPTGPMRCYLYRPANPHRPDAKYPGVVLYSEIFQQTQPIARLALQLCGQGYLVLVPEVFHEHEPAGTVIGYDEAGRDNGNRYKVITKLSTFDADAGVALGFLRTHPRCTGSLGTFGVCLGGHLAFRAALSPQVSASACFYATDLHTATLGEGMNDDTLARVGEMKGELMLVWGRQDPHVPPEGRVKIHAAVEAAGVHFTWHEFNAVHAFMRDDGPRYDPTAARLAMGLAFDLFGRCLHG